MGSFPFIADHAPPYPPIFWEHFYIAYLVSLSHDQDWKTKKVKNF